MPSVPPDVDPPADPILFQEPPRGPGRPRSSTSTTTTPPPDSSPEPPSPLAEPSTPAGPASSTSDHRGDPGESASAPASLSPGSGEPAAALAGAIRAGIVSGTHAAHNLATDDIGRALGAYLVTKQELDEASEGAARILKRKVPAGLIGRDVQDGVRVAVALVSYLGRQFQIWTRARAARRAPALGPAAQTEEAGHDLHQ